MRKSGIYIIKNSYKNIFYVGSSVDLITRIKYQFWCLKTNRLFNNDMQRDYNLMPEAFMLIAVKYCDVPSLATLEQSYINKLKNVYNKANATMGRFRDNELILNS